MHPASSRFGVILTGELLVQHRQQSISLAMRRLGLRELLMGPVGRIENAWVNGHWPINDEIKFKLVDLRMNKDSLGTESESKW
ncbi:hypothetical protein Ddc_10053 [Ditylenchus destructor]|nr:hypothetical protein Ddc_10053 [Ditylenchus destructor]